MDTKELCLKIEQAAKSLTPLSVTLLKHDDRIATVRVIAEAFAGMKLPKRVTAMLACLNDYDSTLLKSFDLTFELLSPAESTSWGSGSTESDTGAGNESDKVAARDAEI